MVDLSALTPTVDQAGGDRPSIYGSSCHAAATEVPELCLFGDEAAQKVMVAIGDSHMAQWFAPLNAAAVRGSYRLLWATKRGCPAATVTVRSAVTKEPRLDCDVWRAALLELIAELPRVDMVVMSSSHWAMLLEPGTNTVITSERDRERSWHSGMTVTIRALSPAVRRILVIRDTPRPRFDVPTCLAQSGGDTRLCTQSRDRALKRSVWRAEKQLTSEFSMVRVAQLTSAFCTSVKCRPVTDSLVLRYRDDDHLTNTFATLLSGRLGSRIRAAAS